MNNLHSIYLELAILEVFSSSETTEKAYYKHANKNLRGNLAESAPHIIH